MSFNNIPRHSRDQPFFIPPSCAECGGRLCTGLNNQDVRCIDCKREFCLVRK